MREKKRMSQLFSVVVATFTICFYWAWKVTMNLREEMLKYVVFDAAVLTPMIRLYLYYILYLQKSSFHALRFLHSHTDLAREEMTSRTRDELKAQRMHRKVARMGVCEKQAENWKNTGWGSHILANTVSNYWDWILKGVVPPHDRGADRWGPDMDKALETTRVK